MSRLQNLARLLLKNPSILSLGQYFKCKKAYRRTIKSRKRIFEKGTITTQHSISAQPKEFCSFLRKLGGGQNIVKSPLPGEVWVDYFSTLSQKDPSLEHVDNLLGTCR